MYRLRTYKIILVVILAAVLLYILQSITVHSPPCRTSLKPTCSERDFRPKMSHPLPKHNAERLRRLRSTCRLAEGGHVDRVTSDPRTRTAYCVVPKTSCTFWLSLFQYLQGNGEIGEERDPVSISRQQIHSADTLREMQFQDIGVDNTLPANLANHFRFMFVRDPYSRLWSAYIDKLLLLDFWDLEGPKIVRFLSSDEERNEFVGRSVETAGKRDYSKEAGEFMEQRMGTEGRRHYSKETEEFMGQRVETEGRRHYAKETEEFMGQRVEVEWRRDSSKETGEFRGKGQETERRRFSQCYNDISFAEFVRYVVGGGEGAPWTLNEHWRPVQHVCDPCSFCPHLLARVETFAQDSLPVLHRLNLTWVLSSYRHALHQMELLLTENFRQLDVTNPLARDHKFYSACTNSSDVARRLWSAFQMYGYIPRSSPYPEALLSPEPTAERFQEVAFRTHRGMSESVRATMAEQRHSAMVEAYRSVPVQTLEKLSSLYLYEFLAFGYDMRPYDLFESRYEELVEHGIDIV